MTYGIVFAIGLCIGSFLNVCIYRIPAGKSIVFPGSACPNCNQFIRFYDNIPIISFLLLKGKCRFCKNRISFRYPAIELLTGVSSLLLFLKFGISIEWVIYFAFTATLITISFIDIDHQIIPDVISLPGILLCVAASFALPNITFIESITGLIAGGGSLYMVALIYYFLRKNEGMGGGDIKLLAMIGALIGWQGVLFTIFISSAAGTIGGVIIMILTRNNNSKLRIPFGPYLSAAAILYIAYGHQIIKWYINFITS
ncbi:MAG: prepilin peptidase [Desulfobacteraceae bacterium 4572_19]|nr:MAG: prepilin peptidase [Desulfobacteraceae bacterium 4572_19]